VGNRAVFLALFCAAAAIAQTLTERPAGVAGSVINSLTGATLPHAHVILNAQGLDGRTYGALTTAEGSFSINGVSPGAYSVTIEHAGYLMPDGPGIYADINLRSGEKKDNLVFRLVPAGSIRGRVTNLDGEPLEGVRVETEAAPGAFADRNALTDAKGEFRIGGLPVSKYRIKATPSNAGEPPEKRSDGAAEKIDDQEDAPTYYPNALNPHDATRVNVNAGAESSGIDVKLARVPVIEVSGKAEGPDGSSNPQLWVASADGRGRSFSGIKRDGTFRIWGLFPGEYEISAVWQGSDGREFRSPPATLEVAGSNIDHLLLRMVEPANITGHLEFQNEAAKPAQNSSLRLTLINTGLNGNSFSMNVAVDGTFRLFQVPAGKYRLLPSWKNVYIPSMKLGSREIEGSLLDLSAGSSSEELSVRLGAAVGTISGVVSDEKGPVAAARVALVFDQRPNGVPPRIATSNAEGIYSFSGVAPGRYKIVAVQEEDNDIAQGAAIDGYDEVMDSIEMHPAEKISHNLKRQAPPE
jgi:protocatechuate 3,4-dioxygenase beta subunit